MHVNKLANFQAIKNVTLKVQLLITNLQKFIASVKDSSFYYLPALIIVR